MDDLLALLMLLFVPTTVLMTVRIINVRAARHEAIESALAIAAVGKSASPVGRY